MTPPPPSYIINSVLRRIRVKILLRFIGYGVIIISLAGCSLLRHGPRADNAAGVFPSYSGPKAHVVIADFDVKAAKATSEVGAGVREMLATALENSNRFLVVERQQAQAAIAKEQELSAPSGTPSPANNGAQKDTAKTLELVITASLSEFEPQASGGRAGVGGGGGAGSGVLGGLLGSTVNKAHIALDINIVDAVTSETLAATHVQGQASDVSGTIKGGIFGSGGLGAGLSAYANTPMEKAIRICVIEAVRYICQTIPADYYKY